MRCEDRGRGGVKPSVEEDIDFDLGDVGATDLGEDFLTEGIGYNAVAN